MAGAGVRAGPMLDIGPAGGQAPVLASCRPGLLALGQGVPVKVAGKLGELFGIFSLGTRSVRPVLGQLAPAVDPGLQPVFVAGKGADFAGRVANGHSRPAARGAIGLRTVEKQVGMNRNFPGPHGIARSLAVALRVHHLAL